MLASLNCRPDEKPDVFIKEVSTAAKEFTGEASQFDDMTMVGMTWYGKDCEKTESLHLC